jgi:polar amino acid transport system substrate-binding protein
MARLIVKLAALSMAFHWLLPMALAVEVTVYDYHLKPPFILDVDKRLGLDFDITEYLNSKQQDFHFHTEFMPRNRINALLATGSLDGLVIGVDELWFHDQAKIRYLWSPSYLPDEDVVVSLKTRPISYSGPESLIGLNVGFPQGYYYFGITELAEANKLNRDYAPSEENNLKKLAAHRIDVTIVSRSTYNYLLKAHPEWRNVFSIASTPEERFERHFLIPTKMTGVHALLKRLIPQALQDPAWQRLFDKYQ